MKKSNRTQADSQEDLSTAAIDKVLNERRTTHGLYSDNSETYDQLTKIVDLDRLRPEQKLAMSVILQKICRIQNGDPDFEDHWRDMEGYAKLSADSLLQEQSKECRKGTTNVK